jgi:hypothetical protein
VGQGHVATTLDCDCTATIESLSNIVAPHGSGFTTHALLRLLFNERLDKILGLHDDAVSRALDDKVQLGVVRGNVLARSIVLPLDNDCRPYKQSTRMSGAAPSESLWTQGRRMHASSRCNHTAARPQHLHNTQSHPWSLSTPFLIHTQVMESSRNTLAERDSNSKQRYPRTRTQLRVEPSNLSARAVGAHQSAP